MYRLIVSALVGAVGSVLLLGGSGQGQGTKAPTPKSPKPDPSLVKFTDFHNHVKSATYESYKKKKGVKVQNKAAFEKMRAHLLDRHKNYPVKHTFVQDGHPIDCVPINQQPSLQSKLLAGHKVQLEPPAFPRSKEVKGGKKAPAKAEASKGGKKAPGKIQPIRLALRKGQKDKLGNEMAAPAGTIPIRRLTLDDLTRFRTLEDYQSQRPSVGSSLAKSKADVQSVSTFAGGFQDFPNLGVQAFMGLWQPTVPPEASSTCQVTTFGTDMQEIEAGWEVNPSKFKTNQPVLFVGFGTPQTNNKIILNHDPGSNFVQTNNSVVLGGPLGPVSVPGGAQHGLTVGVRRDDQGNWWLLVSGVDKDGPTGIGYYPPSVFQGGTLASRLGSSHAVFGGRVVRPAGTGGVQMGSGAFAAGANQAASLTNCILFTQDPFSLIGGPVPARLTNRTDDSTIYTADLGVNNGPPLGTFFFYGGPGPK
jgi:hypothetical protein